MQIFRKLYQSIFLQGIQVMTLILNQNSRYLFGIILKLSQLKMADQLAETTGSTNLQNPIGSTSKDLAVELETETYETIQVSPSGTSQQIQEAVQVQESEIRTTVNTTTHQASIYIIPLEDGRLFVGSAKNLKQELELIPHKPVENISPIILPKKSKLDLAKYWHILANKYGEENVVTADPSLHEYYKKAFGGSDYAREFSQSSKATTKKITFKFKTVEKSGLMCKIKGLMNECRKIVSKLPGLRAIKS